MSPNDEGWQLLEATPDALVVASKDGRIVYANQLARRLFGYEGDELLGLEIEALVPERFRAAHRWERARFHERGRTRAMGFERVLLARCKDGRELPVSINLGPLVFRGVDSVVASVRDMTHEVEAIAAMRAAKAQVEANSAELEAFSDAVAHALRVPLRIVEGFGKVLAERHADQLDDEGKRLLARVRAGAERIDELLGELLELFRVSRALVTRHPVDLAELARQAITQLRESEPERVVDLVLEGPLVVRGDKRLLVVLMDNLLSNAWKFTRRRAHAHITVGSETRDGERITFVRDDGEGFDLAHAERLFSPFHRLHHHHDAHGHRHDHDLDGSGLGLATAKRIVHRHGGRIWADATPGRGATFHFTIDGGAGGEEKGEPIELGP